MRTDPAVDRQTFSSIRDLMTRYRFHPKIAALAFRVHAGIDSEDEARIELHGDQQQSFIEALQFLQVIKDA